jgi:glycosyltransferase involved in cell wall biosynthesis
MKALIVHYSFESIGGAERVSLKIIKHLANTPGITIDVLSFNSPSASQISSLFGESLPENINFKSISKPRKFSRLLFELSVLQKTAKKIAPNYNLCISTYNEFDFGKKAIQYVHHPVFAQRDILQKYQIVDSAHFLNKYPLLEKMYQFALRRYSGAKPSNWYNNITLTNSHFMSGVLKECGYSNSHVLYPGFIELRKSASKTLKKKQIIALGRIEPDKHTLSVVEYYAEIQKSFPDLECIIAGTTPSPDYLNAVRSAISLRGANIRLELNRTREDVLTLLEESLYYINPKPFEHFGIAATEAIQAGCLPILHNSGGSKEIVEDAPLLYDSISDVVRIIKSFEQDASLRNQTLVKLNKGLTRFTTEFVFQRF